MCGDIKMVHILPQVINFEFKRFQIHVKAKAVCTKCDAIFNLLWISVP